MSWKSWARQVHRWLAITFTFGMITYIVAMGQSGQPPIWMGLLALVALILLLASGLYLFALPYFGKRARA